MGKNQTITKNTQSQGVCEKIFKALNLSSLFLYFSRNTKSASINSATKFKLVVAQNGSTNFPLHDLKGHQIIPLNDQNRIHVEYNHNTKEESMNKFPADIIATSNHQQNQDYPKGVKSEDYNDRISTSNGRFSEYIDHVKNKIMSSCDDDEDDDDDSSVVGKAVTRRVSFNDEVSNYVDQSKFQMIRTTAIACGD
ncbi:hypothetical protein K7X08_032778 [Anisodus acutangulus]|uniref:Uncharacterized protein n=1 Tax=Anisodus acutangulus TaxID=402998 RepID=A0A9Q1M4D4_9SOLA|nr:hypothetical protein K7X08_032778 [Anisodus acutangulus]